MPFQVIQDFRYGLDTRRSRLTSVLGTLLSIQDAHINQGGEIEKRKAFMATGGGNAYVLPDGTTLGLQETAAGLVVFGGSPTPGTMPTLRVGSADSTVIYQQLVRSRSYCVSAAVVLDPNTRFLMSECFGGKAFVICLLDDGTYCAFYDGVPIDDFFMGMVLLNPTGTGVMSAANIAEMMADAVTRREAVAKLGYSSLYTATNDYFIVKAPGQTSITPSGTLVLDSPPTYEVPSTNALWKLTVEEAAKVGYGKPATAAVGAFTIVAGDTGASVEEVNVNGVNVLAGSVTWQGTAEATAAAVAALIGGGAYTATSKGGTVAITTEVKGVTPINPNGFVVEVVTLANSSAAIMIGECTFGLSSPGLGTILNHIWADIQEILPAPPYTFNAGPFSSWLQLIASYINGNANQGGTGRTDYYALGQGSNLLISKRVTSSSDPPLSIILDFTGGITGDPNALHGEIMGAGGSATVGAHNSGSDPAIYYSDPVFILPHGGSGHYTYDWSAVSTSSLITGTGVAVSTDAPGTATAWFSGSTVRENIPASATIKCVLGDGTGTYITLTIEVVFVIFAP